MKTYVGRRSGGVCEVWVEGVGNHSYDLPLCLHVQQHSPTGFEWGYGGSGPAQLALAILCDYFSKDGRTNDEAAEALHQKFKFAVVGGLPKEGWRLTVDEVRTIIDNMRKNDPAVWLSYNHFVEKGEPALVPADVCMGCSADRVNGRCPNPECTWGKDDGSTSPS